MNRTPDEPVDDGAEKVNQFKEAFERGQRGQIGSFDVWLEDHGFISERVNKEYLTEYFREYPERTADHQEEIDAIAEYVGFGSRHGGTHHLPIVGATGIGKTQLLYTISYLVSKVENGINTRILDAITFHKKGKEQLRLFEIVEEISRDGDEVLLVDNCGWDKQASYSLAELGDADDVTLILSVWEPESWRRSREKVVEKLPVATEIHLEPFSESTMFTALTTMFNILSDDDDPPEEYLRTIQTYSYGIPALAQQLLLESLHEAFVKDIKPVQEDSVESAAEKLNLKGVRERIYNLSDSKLTIIRHLLLSYDKRGTQPSQLVDLLDRDKSTISYHLRTLSDANIVQSTKKGRQVFYSTREELKPLLQIRLDEEGG